MLPSPSLVRVLGLAVCFYAGCAEGAEYEDAPIAPQADVPNDVAAPPPVCGSTSGGRTGLGVIPDAFLPDECLPRCNIPATAAYNFCVDSRMGESCFLEAWAMDTRPAVFVQTAGGIVSVSCSGEGAQYRCQDWQLMACAASLCDVFFDAWVKCTATDGGCDMEREAALGCAEISPEWATCVRERVFGCLSR